MKRFSAIIFILIFACTSLTFAGSVPIGSIKTVEGQAFIIRDGKSIVPTTGTRIFQNDTLKTQSDGTMGVVFRDEAVLALGPETEMVLDEFMFAPSEGEFSMIVQMLKGTAAYLSGLMVKVSPGSARVDTPMGSIGFRGTKCLIKVAAN